MTDEQIAQTAHEANRAYCQSLGDYSQVGWDDAPRWQQQSCLSGVAMHVDGKKVHPGDSHKHWLKDKEAAGWKYGKVKDVAKKEHPCFVPFGQLPADQKAKDFIFCAVVSTLVALRR